MVETYGFIEMYLVSPGLKLWRVLNLTAIVISEVAVLVGGCA